MATERQAPDVLLDQTGLTGALTAIDEDPDADGGDWLTTSNNTPTVCRTSFPTPTGAPTDGVDVQEFRCLVRKTNHSTDPNVRVELYENGSLVTELIADQALSTITGVVLSAKWDSVNLGTDDGSLVEVRIVGTPGSGSQSNRASVEVGAVEWNVDYSTVVTLTPSPVTAAWSVVAPTVTIGAVTVSPAAVVAAWSVVTPSVVVDVTLTPAPVVAVWSVVAPSIVIPGGGGGIVAEGGGVGLGIKGPGL